MTKDEAHEIAQVVARLSDSAGVCIALNEMNLPFLWTPGRTYLSGTACATIIFVNKRYPVEGKVIQLRDSSEDTP